MAESARKVDQNGYINIERNPISRSGIFQYKGKSIGADDPERIYNVYRPESELTDPEAIESFKLIPLVDDHAMLGSQDEGLLPAEQKGVHGATGDLVEYKDGVLYSNLKIFSNYLADMLKRGKKDLSLGYRCIYEKVSGTLTNGQTYDYIQRKLRGNHLALVDEARCAVSVLDQHMAFDHFDLALDLKEFTMADNKDDDKKKDDKGMDARISRVLDWAESRMARDAKEDEEKEEKAKEKKDAEDKRARDEAERTAKPGGTAGTITDAAEKEKMEADKKAKDESEKKDKEGMDSAIKTLTGEVTALKKNLVKEIFGHVAQRDALAEKLSVHVGTFDSSDKTLAEVAEYGVKKLGLECSAGHELTAINAYLHNRSASNAGFSFDKNDGGSAGGKLATFLDKRAS